MNETDARKLARSLAQEGFGAAGAIVVAVAIGRLTEAVCQLALNVKNAGDSITAEIRSQGPR